MSPILTNLKKPIKSLKNLNKLKENTQKAWAWAHIQKPIRHHLLLPQLLVTLNYQASLTTTNHLGFSYHIESLFTLAIENGLDCLN
jgi:hypothetical protein